ncbi:HprK-related kinase B [Rhodopirellula sallentina]|uniref:HprK-related kinase B n=1 Tax=Rhodopirellula sallentina TaxID=1263869 RepID=UPI001F273ECC|nr:HprK-related kinase B [Rhodopirellula sallentina]
MPSLSTVAEQLTDGVEIAGESVVLGLDDFLIRVRSNSVALLQGLRRYFAHVVVERDEGVRADCTVLAIESGATDLGLSFVDWKREPGKSGRKDSYVDLAENDQGVGRLVRKVRTGMLFLQSETHRIAHGPCLANDNQVINFINCQYMNWLQQRGSVICHASAIAMDGRALAIAGFSGGGKSSLMLRLMELAGTRYVTNDRLFLESNATGEIQATGIPKLPRVNPGTIVSLSSLRPMLDETQIETYESLSPEHLWQLEQKFDVDVTKVYGSDRITLQSPMRDLLILNWDRTSDATCRIEPVDLRERPELLKAVTKSPGPFYVDARGQFQRDDVKQEIATYQDLLDRVDVWEASGKVDFDMATQTCQSILRKQPC